MNPTKTKKQYSNESINTVIHILKSIILNTLPTTPQKQRSKKK